MSKTCDKTVKFNTNYNLSENNCSLNDEDFDEHNHSLSDDQNKSLIDRSDTRLLSKYSANKPKSKSTDSSDDSNGQTNAPKIQNNFYKRLESIEENVGLEDQMEEQSTVRAEAGEHTGSDAEPQLTPHMKDRFRRKLRYHFMSPIDKFRAKRRLPFKLLIQVFKIVLITLQLMIFGFDMSTHLAQESNGIISFRELFLSNWDPVREVMAYPPAAGPFAIYTKDDFFASVDFAVKQFSNISDLSIGSFGYAINRTVSNRNMSDILVRRQHYENGTAEPSDYVYVYDNKVTTDWLTIGELYPPNDRRWVENFSSFEFFNSHNFALNFDRLIEIELIFQLRTIYLNSLAEYNAPKCYDLNVSILYDNTEHDGQLLVRLTTVQVRHQCNGNLANNSEDRSEHFRRQLLNWSVVVFSFLSSILCIRSLYSGQLLRRETEEFFGRHYRKRLELSERLEFIDLWIVMIVVNDVLILTGSALKMQMESRLIENIHYTTVSILLGVGNLLVWAGLLRYLQFFHKYNILILTLRRAIPHVLRFLLCAVILYGGFCFCGWVVLGPYHLKFRTLSRASECLFSLMNGDDMFATFYITDYRQQLVIWWFSRIYLYLFVCLFIYVVLSLFIALIMDSYETIKDFYENGMPMSDLQKFIAECRDESSSRAYLEDRQTSIADTINLCFNCCTRSD